MARGEFCGMRQILSMRKVWENAFLRVGSHGLILEGCTILGLKC